MNDRVRVMAGRAAWLALCGLLMACEASDSGGGGDDPGADGAGGMGQAGDGDGDAPADYVYSACDRDARVGGFQIIVNEDNGYSSVEGQIKDGIIPTNIPELVTSAGDCALVRGRDLFCDPACSPGQTCDEDGTCIAEPAPHDAGAVDIDGLLDAVHMEPLPPALNYNNRGTLMHPAFEEGAAIVLHAAGGEFSPFSLVAEGVAPLDLGDATVSLEDGSPVALQWTAPAQAARARVLVTLNISLHGGNPVRIECEAADTGTLTIPAELVSELLGYGYSGFPAVEVIRQTAGSMELPVGCIDLRVAASRARLPVEIPGLISCNGNDDCPAGQACQEDLSCG